MPIIKPLLVAVIVIISGLGAWSWHQSKIISSLAAKNQTQARIIQQQEQANLNLTRALEAERVAVEQQHKITESIKRESNEQIKNLRAILQNDHCANTKLPADVIKWLRNPDNHKD